MYKMTPAPVESKLPVINTLDESDSEVSLPLAVTSVVVGGVGDGASRTSKVGSPLRRPKPQEMTRSMPEAPTATRGGMEEDELDEEMAAITMLRCTSLQTEEIAKREREKKERQARRNNRYTEYECHSSMDFVEIKCKLDEACLDPMCLHHLQVGRLSRTSLRLRHVRLGHHYEAEDHTERAAQYNAIAAAPRGGRGERVVDEGQEVRLRPRAE